MNEITIPVSEKKVAYDEAIAASGDGYVNMMKSCPSATRLSEQNNWNYQWNCFTTRCEAQVECHHAYDSAFISPTVIIPSCLSTFIFLTVVITGGLSIKRGFP
ncbi:hypothetical protein NL676_033105 [Syzygium grande]|nr:hypothetical protein NL676_033105 [Syzygium grande]